jgi:peptidoglycan/LPS O-acetylase OafA/YrhL
MVPVMPISKKLSHTIMVANLIAIVGVLVIHYYTGVDVVPPTLNLNHAVQKFLFTELYGFAVPFFAMASGFFFYLKWKGLATYRRNLKKRVSTLFVPYVLASGLILVSYVVIHVTLTEYTDKGYTFTVVNVLRDWLFHPVAGQFWFLRDLLVLVVISPLLYIPHKRYSLLLGGVLFVLWLFEFQVFPIVFGWYLINVEMLFFFWLGGYMTFHVDFLEGLVEMKARWVSLLAGVWLALAVTHLIVDPTFYQWYVRDYTLISLLLFKFSILAALPLVLAVSARLVGRPMLYLARYSFFVFLFHNYPLYAVVTRVSERLVGVEYSYYLNVVLATVAVFLAAILCAAYLTPLYNVLTGGRTARISEQQAAPAQPTGNPASVSEG